MEKLEDDLYWKKISERKEKVLQSFDCTSNLIKRAEAMLKGLPFEASVNNIHWHPDKNRIFMNTEEANKPLGDFKLVDRMGKEDDIKSLIDKVLLIGERKKGTHDRQRF